APADQFRTDPWVFPRFPETIFKSPRLMPRPPGKRKPAGMTWGDARMRASVSLGAGQLFELGDRLRVQREPIARLGRGVEAAAHLRIKLGVIGGGRTCACLEGAQRVLQHAAMAGDGDV